jgi:putative PEP-CTERM system histidine kinase
MESFINSNSILLANLVLLASLALYLAFKAMKHASAIYFVAFILSFVPLIFLELGSYLFINWPNSALAAKLILLATALTPITIVPASHILGRTQPTRSAGWTVYYAAQIALLVFFVKEVFNGRVIEWVTGILEQPIVIVDSRWSYYFLIVIVASVLALLCFDKTLREASKPQKDELKFVLIAFLGFAVYFSYLSVNIVIASYVSQAMLQLGAAIIFFGLCLLVYSFVKYPLWEVRIRVSRHLVFGSLSATAAIVYLIISGAILDLLRFIEPQGLRVLLPTAAFALVILFLSLYLSPKFHNRAKAFLTRNFFRNKYDYRDLWMKFSDKSSGSLNIRDVLPRIGAFVVDAMFVRQVAIWLRSASSENYELVYQHDHGDRHKAGSSILRLDRSRSLEGHSIFFHVPRGSTLPAADFPFLSVAPLIDLGIERFVLVEKDNEILAVIGIGAQADSKSKAEDEQFLSSVGNQLGHLILTHKLSEELLLAREWDSFNRFASFILHDLKNLATLQGMTLENAKHFSQNPEFLSDAFATFAQTTDKMINLIASLSVQRGQFSLKQQPVNILEVISNTFDHLKIKQRNGVEVRTTFPPTNQLRPVSGDPDLLQKAFTNLLLNAIQSLPKGEGLVEITVSNKIHGKITASISDSGCGISPERLGSLFRPFQTTKEKGLGIGLCHTRSIIEVHGGQIRIESELNAGTKVEVELPTL